MDARPLERAGGHWLQLDGLRALAVAAVCWHHWMPRRWHAGIHWGALGVDLFFVLSGFLITGILLGCRRHHEEGVQSVGSTVRRFYARRFLRIFPLYYAVLAVATLALSLEVGVIASLWTYTFNLYGGLRGELSGTLVSHFWSLSVEEQFYLAWPWVILLVPRGALTAVIACTIAVGPLSRLALFLAGAPNDALRMATTSCLDLLAGGALFAWCVERRGLEAVRRGALVRASLWIGLPLFLWGLAILGRRGGAEGATALEVLVVTTRWPFFAWLVVAGAARMRGAFGRLLESRPLVYLGKISYGVYVLHAFALVLDRAGLRAWPPLARLVAYAAFTLALAALSWHLFESRINAWKSRFPYRVEPALDGAADRRAA